MISITGLLVFIWRWWIFCWNSSLRSPSTNAFFACGIVGALLSVIRRAGLWWRYWFLAGLRSSKNIRLVDRKRIFFPPLHIKLSLIAVCQSSRQGWWLLHLLVPGFSMIGHWKVEIWYLWQSSNPSAHQRTWVWKFNEQSWTGSEEGFCSGHEELFFSNKAENHTELVTSILKYFQESHEH